MKDSEIVARAMAWAADDMIRVTSAEAWEKNPEPKRDWYRGVAERFIQRLRAAAWEP